MSQIKAENRTEIVKEQCRQFRDLPNQTLAKLIYRNHPHLFNSVEAVRSCVRTVRGNSGKKKREKYDGELYRPNGSQSDTWNFPQSIAPDYEPVQLDAERTLILSDLHIPFHDRAAIEAAIAHGAKQNPDCILLNGDVCDFYSASRFERIPNASTLKLELDSTREFLGWLRQKFPKAQIIYKLGNHDEWFERYIILKAPELFGVDGLNLQHLVTGQIGDNRTIGGISWVTDQRKITAGKLSIWHGHEVGKGSIAPPVNPACGLFRRTLECGLMGHLHKDSMHSETSSSGKLVTCWSTGCLAGLWPRYARVNKWSHGAAFLRLQREMFSVEPIRILNGSVL